MNDPRDPDPQSQSPEPEGASLPERLEHGVEAVGEAVVRVEQTVEQAAEDVAQEVAEHVPLEIRRPVRWTIKRLVVVIVLGAILAVALGAWAVAYYAWNHTQWASHELTGRVNDILRAHSGLELSVARVRGNPLSFVDVQEPRIQWRDEDGPALLSARSMRLRYSTWNLLSSERGAVVIEIDRPVVRLVRGPDGRLRLPTWEAGPPRRQSGKGRGFDLVLRIRDGDLLAADPELSIEGVDLDARVATGGPTALDVQSLSWKKGFYGFELERLRGAVVVDDSVRINLPELRGSDLALSGRARWRRGEGVRQVNARIDRVRWTWLARVFRNKTFDVPGEGSFDIEARGERAWEGEAKTASEWNGLRLASTARFGWHDGRLTLDPLEGKSEAGDLSRGRLTWSKRGWEIEGQARGVDPTRWGVIGLHGWPAGQLQGRFRYAVDTSERDASARLEAWLGSSALAGWSVDSARVDVVTPAGAADSFRVRGMRRGGVFTLGARIHPHGWSGPYEIERFPLDEWPDGRATGISGTLAEGAGHVEVVDGAMRVTGTLSGTGTRWMGADVTRWRLDDVRGRLLPTPNLEARVRLEDLFYLGLHFDSAAAPILLGDGTLAFPGLQAWAGDTVVTMSAGADWDENGWKLAAIRAGMRSSRFDWTAEAPLELSGDSRAVRFDRMVATDGDARVEVTGRWAGPGGSYDWRARGDRMRLERLGLPAELGLGGTAHMELAVTGDSGDPRWTFIGHASDPMLESHRADSLELRLSGAPGRVNVDEFRLELDGGAFLGSGLARSMTKLWPDSLTAGGVIAWIATAGAWQGRFEARQVPLDQLGRLSGRNDGLGGRLEGTLDLAGSPAHPEFDLALESRPATIRKIRIDAFAARARYRGDRFELTDFRMVRDQAVSTASGEIQVELALGREPKLLDAPMRWRIHLPNGDLALAPLLVPQIGAASGRFVIDAEVRGTPRRPEVFGGARIHQGTVRIAQRGEVMDRVEGRFRFEGSKVVLDSLAATQRTQFAGAVGRVTGSGSIDLRADPGPSYAFDLLMRDFTAFEEGQYAARFDGRFRIVNGHRVRGQVLPHVTSDNVVIRNAVISYDFTRQTEQQQVQAASMPLYWTYLIHVQADDNLYWRPPDGDIEFTADLVLDQSPDRLLIFGDMESTRGVYYFLSNRFTVRRATLTFDDVGGVDPLIDSEAVTTLTLSPGDDPALKTGGASAYQRTNIAVQLQGRSSRPAVTFTSSPVTLDQAEILQALTVGRFEGEQRQGAFDSYLSRAISRQLSAELAPVFRGYLSEWEVQKEAEGVGGFMVRVGSQINDRFAVRYGQRLPGAVRQGPTATNTSLVERDIEAEYRLNRFFYLTSQVTQKRLGGETTSQVSTTPDFNVNLKARWEY